ncbi:multisubunit sodium/proton antiporter, MrpG subunit [Microlunatus sagamiharensis]|uniref:Multisubunit sodium/proton antiporter, MrpG subunit n=1 Tax=Microlunatus sagamiharensis TaxID=546874 RepID=A0A1H2LQ87_9ACTN|nr:monovalent cation/H(+) antiporter subunit G [Microlunatus sagamiharensis]SDU82994.1 multisubunit sodium/proton antiporter, MrpG subunit [Microlunatus sagamiharensis]
MTGSSVADVLDLLGAFLVLVGCFLCFAAALGLLRFPDVVSRMHAATKPQTLGLIVLAAGVEVSLRSWASFGTLVLVAAFQLATAPVSAHLVGRTVYRTDQVRHELLVRDDLARDLEAAGFRLGPAPEDEQDPDAAEGDDRRLS